MTATPTSDLAPAPRRPYPGLRPFRRDESDLFFGRDDQVDQLLDKLAEIRGWSAQQAETLTTDAFFALFDRIPRP